MTCHSNMQAGTCRHNIALRLVQCPSLDGFSSVGVAAMGRATSLVQVLQGLKSNLEIKVHLHFCFAIYYP